MKNLGIDILKSLVIIGVVVFFAYMITRPANAECVIEQTTNADIAGEIESIRNLEKVGIFPIVNQSKCVVTFEAKINGEWYEGRGSYAFTATDDEDRACAAAFNFGKTQLLEELFPQSIQSSERMVCTEDEQQRTGLEGLTPMNMPFVWDGADCDRFADTVFDGIRMHQWVVIMCHDGERWHEVDRY